MNSYFLDNSFSTLMLQIESRTFIATQITLPVNEEPQRKQAICETHRQHSRIKTCP